MWPAARYTATCVRRGMQPQMSGLWHLASLHAAQKYLTIIDEEVTHHCTCRACPATCIWRCSRGHCRGLMPANDAEPHLVAQGHVLNTLCCCTALSQLQANTAIPFGPGLCLASRIITICRQALLRAGKGRSEVDCSACLDGWHPLVELLPGSRCPLCPGSMLPGSCQQCRPAKC